MSTGTIATPAGAVAPTRTSALARSLKRAEARRRWTAIALTLPLLVFLLATLLVSLLAIKHGGRRGPSVKLGIVAGVLLGLAFASKLTAIIAIVALLLWGAWSFFGDFLARHLPLSWHRDVGGGRRSLVWAVGIVALAFAVFVATNPFLYRDPIGRTLLLFQNRQTEMAAQAEIDPSRAVPTLTERVRLVWRNSLVEDTWTDSRLHLPIEEILAIVGVMWLALRSLRHRAEMLMLLWALGFFSGVTLGLGYVLDHYFVPTAVMGLILSGLTVGWGTRLAWAVADPLIRRRGPGPPQRTPAVA
jgi:hypothetical protein